MQNRFLSLIPVLMGLASLPLLSAQTTEQPRTAESRPSLYGYWTLADAPPDGSFTGEVPPLRPEAMEIYRRNREGVAPDDTGRDDRDPLNYCYPPSVTRLMLLRQFQILQTPDDKEVILLFEWNHASRHIYTDGREHPEGWPFGWMGHSTGKWEGDTLVADTVSMNGRAWFDRSGTPYSDVLHLVERFRRLSEDSLQIEFRFDDPKTFTRPWGTTKLYRITDEEILEHNLCEEELQPRTLTTEELHY